MAWKLRLRFPLGYSALVFLQALLALPVRVPAQVKVPSEVSTVRQSATKAMADCATVSKESRALCAAVAKSRVQEFLAYGDSYQHYTIANRATLTKIRTQITDIDTHCSGIKSNVCTKADSLRSEQSSLLAHLSIAKKQYATTAKRVQNALSTQAGIFKRHSQTNIVCKIRDSGNLDCASLASVIAYYDNQVASIILADIDRLYEVDDINSSRDLLINCYPGVWGTSDLSTFGIGASSPTSQIVTITNSAKITKLCAQLQAAGGSRSVPNGSLTGFSGLTGIDRSGPFDCFGQKGAPTSQEFIQGAMNLWNKMNTACSSELQGSVMEGSDPPPPQPDPKPPDPSDPPPPPPPPPPEDPKVKTQVKKEVTLTDPSTGEQVKVVITTTTYTDGTVVTDSTKSDITSGDPLYGNSSIKRPDGSAVYTIWDKATDGGTEYYQLVVTHDPFRMFSSEWKWSKDGKSRDWLHSGECAGEPCSTCGGIAEMFSGLMSDCLASGGKSLACHNYTNRSECCTNSGIVGDPRVLMPDPNGDFLCVGPLKVDKTKEACKSKCSVASTVSSTDMDCASACMSQRPDMPGFSVLDRVCKYALWDACFSSIVFHVPGSEKPGNVGPQPSPFDPHVLVPPGIGLFGQSGPGQPPIGR